MAEIEYNEFIDDLLKNEIPNRYLFGTFELTRQCNFRCPMCFIRKNDSKGISSERLISIAKHCIEKGLLELTLTGGEVFTREDFFNIYDSIYDMGVLISIMTNAYLLDDTKIEKLLQKPPHAIYITLYGGSNKTYKELCGVESGFSIVYNNIKRLLDGGINVMLQMLLVNQNIDDYEEILNLSKKLNVHLRVNYELFPPIRDSDTNLDDVEHSRLNIDKVPSSLLSESQVFKSNYANNTFFKECNALKNNFFITAEGNLQICQRASYPQIHIHDNIDYSVNSLEKELNRISKITKCIDCTYRSYCNLCLGEIYINENDELSPVKYICENAKIRKYNLQNQ